MIQFCFGFFPLRVNVLFDDLGGDVCYLAAVADNNITKLTRSPAQSYY